MSTSVTSPGESILVVAHARPILPATKVRSTALQTSIKVLRARGHFERYCQCLAPQVRDQILLALAPGWLPIELAVAHYRACDQLALPAAELTAIGEAGADALQGIFLSTLVRGVRAVGITPWSLLSRFDSAYRRLFQGGSVEVERTGPSSAQIEWAGLEGLAAIEYFRAILCGNIRAGYKFVGVSSAHVQFVGSPDRDRIVLATSWR